MHPAASSRDAPFVPGASGPAATLLGAAASHSQHARGDRTRWERFPQRSSPTISHPAQPQGCSRGQPASPSISLTSPFQGQAAQQSGAGLSSPWGLGMTVSPPLAEATPGGSSPIRAPRGAWAAVTIPPPSPRLSPGPPQISCSPQKHPAPPSTPALLEAKEELKCSKKEGKTFPGQSGCVEQA